MDIIKYRQQNVANIPLEFLSYCEERERFLLFLLQLPSMPKSTLESIIVTIQQEIQPFYQDL
jgi:hypothetical protein